MAEVSDSLKVTWLALNLAGGLQGLALDPSCLGAQRTPRQGTARASPWGWERAIFGGQVFRSFLLFA